MCPKKLIKLGFLPSLARGDYIFRNAFQQSDAAWCYVVLPDNPSLDFSLISL